MFNGLQVSQAILLTKTVPGYVWWERLFRMWPVCMCEERIEFIQLDEHGEVKDTGKAKAGSSFWYLGGSRRKFDKVFSEFGRVIMPKNTDVQRS